MLGDGDGRQFSPYSRGWSCVSSSTTLLVMILPVFAGMVPSLGNACRQSAYSPRIRGDGPERNTAWFPHPRFSPYSRGWSRGPAGPAGPAGILPVFAGMVPIPVTLEIMLIYSPRIRGDGPYSLGK